MKSDDEELTDEVKENWTLRLEIKTEAGSMSVSIFYRPAVIQFEHYFAGLLSKNKSGSQNPEIWQFCVGEVEQTLKEIIPQALRDALIQAVRETREVVLRDLNDTPIFRRQQVKFSESEPDWLPPTVAFRFDPNISDQRVERVALVARRNSRLRMKAASKGGSKAKISNYDRLLMDEHYEKLREEAKVILREHTRRQKSSRHGGDRWREEWLKIVDQKFPEWKEAFSDWSKKKPYEKMKPSSLAFVKLAQRHNVSPGTIENIVKEARREKRRMLKR